LVLYVRAVESPGPLLQRDTAMPSTSPSKRPGASPAAIDRTVALFGRGSKEEFLIRIVAAQTHELSSGGASVVTIGDVSHFLAHATKLLVLASY